MLIWPASVRSAPPGGTRNLQRLHSIPTSPDVIVVPRPSDPFKEVVKYRKILIRISERERSWEDFPLGTSWTVAGFWDLPRRRVCNPISVAQWPPIAQGSTFWGILAQITGRNWSSWTFRHLVLTNFTSHWELCEQQCYSWSAGIPLKCAGMLIWTARSWPLGRSGTSDFLPMTMKCLKNSNRWINNPAN